MYLSEPYKTNLTYNCTCNPLFYIIRGWPKELHDQSKKFFSLLFQEDHASGVINPREFQRRLAFCTRKLNEARRCLNDGFSPLDGNPAADHPDASSSVPESASRRLERRAKQKIWHFILCRSQLMDPNRVRFESFVVKEEKDWWYKMFIDRRLYLTQGNAFCYSKLQAFTCLPLINH